MIEDIIVNIVIISFAFYAGWKIRGILMLAAMSDNPERVIKLLEEVKKINKGETKESANDIKVEVEPEKVNDYWDPRLHWTLSTARCLPTSWRSAP